MGIVDRRESFAQGEFSNPRNTKLFFGPID